MSNDKTLVSSTFPRFVISSFLRHSSLVIRRSDLLGAEVGL